MEGVFLSRQRFIVHISNIIEGSEVIVALSCAPHLLQRRSWIHVLHINPIHMYDRK